MKLMTCNSNKSLSNEIASILKLPLTDATIKKFADEEMFVEINENVRGQDVYVIQSTSKPANDHLIELLICIDALKRASAKQITAVIPYFGYARQDRKPGPRTPISAKLVANLITTSGANRVLTIDLHAGQIQGFFDIPVDHLYGSPVIVKYLRSLELKKLVVVSPDAGGLKMADSYAKMLDAGIALVGKQRKSCEDVVANHLVGDVEGRNTLLVDDMTSTAGTLCAAAQLLADAGAQSVRAAVSHSLLSEKGIIRLKESPIVELVTTNTITQRDWGNDCKVTVLSVADLLAEAIMRIHNGQSVSSLFEIKK